MNRLFGEGSSIRQFLAALFDDLLFSVLTLLCSLPLVTAGAAVTALFDVTVQNAAADGAGARDFFRSFSAHFKRATLSWAFLLLFGAAVFYGFRLNAARGGALRIPLWGLLFLGVWLLLLLVLYLPPTLVSHREERLPTVWKRALHTGIALLPRSVLLLLIAAVPFAFYVLLPDIFWYISFLWVFFWPSIAARAALALLRPFYPAFSQKTEETD